MHKEGGITLLELLAVLTIQILLFSLAIPGLGQLYVQAESRSAEVRMMSMLGTARSQALDLGWPATLCPLDASRACGTDWNRALTLFIDQNANARRDSQEEILRYWEPDWGAAWLAWTRNRKAIIYRPNGSTTASTGSLRYCSLVAEKFSFRLVVARTGRYRLDRRNPGCEEF